MLFFVVQYKVQLIYQLKERLEKELPTCNYFVIDLEQYIDKEPFYYD